MVWTDVVVGVDGSPSSRVAVRWAATEAARQGVRLRVVHAYRPPWLAAELVAGASLDTAAREHAQAVVADAVREAQTTAPGTEVTATTVCCHPVPLLVESAGEQSLTVVGSRGRGGFGGVLLGSTGLRLATHAVGPVVVVRGLTRSGNPPVAVGTDGSAAADVAVGVAFDAAAARRCPLTVVHASPHPWEPTERKAALHSALEPWRRKYPNVRVETVMTPADAASALTALSATTQLVVVGTRGRDGFSGLLLGSVGQELVHHAHCPVLVAR